MYLYFFDLDDTICNTTKVALKYLKEHNYSDDIKNLSKNLNKELEDYLENTGHKHIEILENSTVAILKDCIENKKDDVYYITARENKFREKSVVWLEKHNLYLGEERLIMDTEGIKGQVINEIMLQQPHKKFALFFDDLEANHLEAAKYKNIISCLPY